MSRAAARESSPGRQHVVNELPNSAVWAHSPPREEGWTRHQENGAKPPLMERTGWSLTNHVAECVLEPWLVSDHPVCGASVASRLFIDAAATPPQEEGNAAQNNSRIRSHVLTPWATVLRRFAALMFSLFPWRKTV